MPPERRAPSIRYTVRFEHPRRTLRELPGAATLPEAALAAWFGIDAPRYRSICEQHDAVARAAALRVLARPAARAQLRRLPLRPGARIVALGDSLTADACSWAEILRHLLAIGRPETPTQVVNLGVSGDATVHLVSRFHQAVEAEPDVLLLMAGTNDARRHGGPQVPMLVSDAETERNLELLRGLCDGVATARVWLSPPPLVEAQIARAPHLGRAGLVWCAEDVARKAALVHALDETVVETAAVVDDLPRMLLSDGLHLSVLGHEAIVRALLDALAARLT